MSISDDELVERIPGQSITHDNAERQVPKAQRALITAGGFFFNAQGLTLCAG